MGKKTLETRKWATAYRGDLLICSSKTVPIEPAGYALCIVELTAIEPMKKEHEGAACVKLYSRAKVWHLKNLRLVDPIFPVKGQLGIFEVELPRNISFKLAKAAKETAK